MCYKDVSRGTFVTSSDYRCKQGVVRRQRIPPLGIMGVFPREGEPPFPFVAVSLGLCPAFGSPYLPCRAALRPVRPPRGLCVLAALRPLRPLVRPVRPRLRSRSFWFYPSRLSATLRGAFPPCAASLRSAACGLASLGRKRPINTVFWENGLRMVLMWF